MKTVVNRKYLASLRARYQQASKQQKKYILNELCICGSYNRKYAIRLLRQSESPQSPPQRLGRKPAYHTEGVLAVLMQVYKATNLICSKRLRAALPLFLPHISTLSPEDRQLLQTISASTIDRLLKPYRQKCSKLGLSTTKPGSLLKKQIPVRTNQWDETVPGFMEADTVAHCGTSMAGSFVFTVNLVDIATGWTVQRAVWGKGQVSVFEAIKDIESTLPFPLRGFDCDNGSEFLNHHLHAYFHHRRRPVYYTRSRPYHSNDNAHIEQKNWTHIRQYLGYGRFDKQELVNMINDLYRNEMTLLLNFFIPCFKLIDKQRQGARIVKKHDLPKTPLQRLLQSRMLKAQKRRELLELSSRLDPFALQKAISQKVNNILRFASQPPSIF